VKIRVNRGPAQRVELLLRGGGQGEFALDWRPFASQKSSCGKVGRTFAETGVANQLLKRLRRSGYANLLTNMKLDYRSKLKHQIMAGPGEVPAPHSGRVSRVGGNQGHGGRVHGNTPKRAPASFAGEFDRSTTPFSGTEKATLINAYGKANGRSFIAV